MCPLHARRLIAPRRKAQPHRTPNGGRVASGAVGNLVLERHSRGPVCFYFCRLPVVHAAGSEFTMLPMTTSIENEEPLQDAPFPSTHWSVVVAAGHGSSPNSDQALERLCRTYWYPLYAYVRRRVTDIHEARDLMQEFFATLLEKNYIADAKRERGRFRSFLLTAMKHFLANEWRKNKTQKRGGGRSPVPLDFESGELRYSLEPADDLNPEKLFERQWAVAVLANVLSRLRTEYTEKGKEEQFERLKEFLSGEQAGGAYAEVARSLAMTVNAAQVSVHRMRHRYRALLRAELIHTLADADDVDEEIRNLFAVLG